MTTPAHGERRCYLAGCRRPECSQAHYRYVSKYKLDRARGFTRRTNAAPVHRRLKQLLDTGWTCTEIARATGHAPNTIAALAETDHPTTTRNNVATSILRLGNTPSRQLIVNGTGSMRRVRALVALGHSQHTIALATGLSDDVISLIARGQRPRVHATTARRITLAYRPMSRSRGTSDTARALAKDRGWHGPLAWDVIDDPAAQPETTLEERVHRTRALAEDGLELEVQGYSRRHAAERLGVTVDTLQQAIKRHRHRQGVAV